MPAQLERSWTADEVRRELLTEKAWPRYELIDGDLIVTPSPTFAHNCLAKWLYDTLRDYLKREPVGEIMSAPSDLELRPGTISQPDLFVVPAAEFKGAVEVCTEVSLSPRTSR